MLWSSYCERDRLHIRSLWRPAVAVSLPDANAPSSFGRAGSPVSRYAVVGASRGTGFEIVRRLEAEGHTVRAIARRPPEASALIEPFSADVTNIASMRDALAAPFEAIFFTVDVTGGIGGRAFFGSAKQIRDVTYHGFINTIAAISKSHPSPKFILLSVMGVDRSSLVWTVLNAIKPGLKRNILERERALALSRIPYVTLRAPTLTDDSRDGLPTSITDPVNKLDAKRKIARADLAEAMIAAALHAPANTLWDVFEDVRGAAPDWLRPRSPNRHESTPDTDYNMPQIGK